MDGGRPHQMTAYEWFTQYLLTSGSTRQGNSWQCPAHSDGTPSLSVTEASDSRVLVHCFGGCTVVDVMAALGLGMGVLFEPHSNPPSLVLSRQRHPPQYATRSAPRRVGRRQLERTIRESTVHHVYVPDLIRLERCRYSNNKKTCRWEIRDGGYWRYAEGLSLGNLPLYRQSEVQMAQAAGEAIVLCESESSVDAFLANGIYATTWAGGASSPPLEKLQSVLKDAVVVWIPDNDPGGLKCSAVIEDALKHSCELHLLMPDPGDDARDVLLKVGASAMRDSIVPLGRQLGTVVDDLDDLDDLDTPFSLV